MKKISFLLVFLTLGTAYHGEGKSLELNNANQNAFCDTLNQIIAEYQNDFENLKDQFVKRGNSVLSHFTSKVNFPGTIETKITKGRYEAFFAKGLDSVGQAVALFENLEKKLLGCESPYAIKKSNEEIDWFDVYHYFFIDPGKPLFADIRIILTLEDLFEGINVKITIEGAN